MDVLGRVAVGHQLAVYNVCTPTGQFNAGDDDDNNLHNFKSGTVVRTGKNALGINSLGPGRASDSFARTGDKMRTWCERGERFVNEVVELRTTSERVRTGLDVLVTR